MYIIRAGNNRDHEQQYDDELCSYIPSPMGRFANGCRGVTYVYHGYFGRLVINTQLPKIAIKRIQLDSFKKGTEQWSSIKNEPKILMELSNENILRCHCYGRSEDFL